MKLCVCMKVVPDNNQIFFDRENGTLRRNGVPATLNPADLVALEAALQLQSRRECELHVVSMGPESACKALQSAFLQGAQEVFQLRSPLFAGADVMATCYALACFFQDHPSYDLILCGKHSSDGNTGQVGTYLAGQLGIPHVSNVCQILGYTDAGQLQLRQRMDGSLRTIQAACPLLVTVETDLAQPHIPSLREALRAKGKQIQVVGEAELPGLQPERCGLKGSATRVAEIQIPPKQQGAQMLSLEDLSPLETLIKEEWL